MKPDPLYRLFDTVTNIILIHLSDGNSNAELFKKEVAAETGKKVTIASKGIEIDFGKTPF